MVFTLEQPREREDSVDRAQSLSYSGACWRAHAFQSNALRRSRTGRTLCGGRSCRRTGVMTAVSISHTCSIHRGVKFSTVRVPNAFSSFAICSAQSGSDVLCIKHGGGKRCMVAGCKKLVRKNKRCTKHASEALNTVVSAPAPAPAPPVPATVVMNAAKARAAVAATAAVLTATTTTAVVPVAPAPTPRRRPAPPPRPRITEPSGPPSPPEHAEAQTRVDGGLLMEQIEAQARGDGGLLPPVSSMAREPSPNFGPGAGCGSRGGLSSLRLPVAAFDDRVLPAGAPMHDVSVRRDRWVPDGGGHSNGNGNGFSSRSNHNEARLRAPLPGIRSIGSSMLSVDQRSGAREGPMSVGRLAPHGSPAAPLLLSEAGLPRHLLTGGSAAPREGGRPDIANNSCLLARPLQEMVGPSSTRGRPVVDRPLPPYPSGRCSEGATERSPSLSPLPPSLLLQQPPSFPPSYLPAASASASACDLTGGKRVFAWSGDTDNGSRPAAHCDDRGGITPNGSGSYSRAAGELTSTTELARPPAGATASPSAGAIFAGNPGQANGSEGTVTASLLPAGVVGPPVLSKPVAAASQSIGAGHPMPATERPSRPSGCCGGKNGGSKASQGSATAAAAPAPAGDTRQSQTRLCSTSPPLEQTSSFISLNVAGMMCMENCGQTVQRALREVRGVQSVTIHFPTRTASVKVRSGRATFCVSFFASHSSVGGVSCATHGRMCPHAPLRSSVMYNVCPHPRSCTVVGLEHGRARPQRKPRVVNVSVGSYVVQ